MEFLKAALDAQRKARGEEPLSAVEFMKKVRSVAASLELNPEFLKRGVNEGFSGGEKKRNEILQMLMLQPKLAILDETDSGLDIDALQTVAAGVNRFRGAGNGILMVTHYQRLLDYIKPDTVHVLADGRIVKSGDHSLALKLEAQGYGWITDAALSVMQSHPFIDSALARSRQLDGRLPLIVDERRSSIAEIARDGIPSGKLETWKYTPIQAFFAAPFADARSPTSHTGARRTFCRSPARFRSLVGEPLVRCSERPGVEPRRRCRSPLNADLDLTRYPLALLNTALLEDGLVIRIAPGVDAGMLDLRFASGVERGHRQPGAHRTRRGQPAAAHRTTQRGSADELGAGHPRRPDARSCNTRASLPPATRALLVSGIRFTSRHNATYDLTGHSMGSATRRNDIHVRLDGQHASTSIDLACAAHRRDRLDHQTVDRTHRRRHRQPPAGSRHRHRQQRTHVQRPHSHSSERAAQRRTADEPESAARQESARSTRSRSSRSTRTTCKCSHGATVGQIDPAQVFYLRTRGTRRSGGARDADARIPARAHDALARSKRACSTCTRSCSRMKRRTDIAALRDDFPLLGKPRRRARRSSISTAPPPHRSRRGARCDPNYYVHDNANVHRAAHALADRATQAFEGARAKAQAFIGAAHLHEIVWTRGTTESINLVAHSYGGSVLRRGDEILISVMEHHSNIVPWQLVAQRTGATVRAIDVNDRGELDLDDYARKLTERTKIVAIGHVSNALGTINPIKQIIAAAHAAGAVVLIDGAQAAAHLPIDVRRSRLRLLCALGPQDVRADRHRRAVRQGASARRDAAVARRRRDDRNRDDRAQHVQRLPYKFEAGTPDIAGAVGLGAAIDYLEQHRRATRCMRTKRGSWPRRARASASSKACASSATLARNRRWCRSCSTAAIRRTSARCSTSSRSPCAPGTIARCR